MLFTSNNNTIYYTGLVKQQFTYTCHIHRLYSAEEVIESFLCQKKNLINQAHHFISIQYS